jgi:hypothetical protein
MLRDHVNDSLPPTADWGDYDMNFILSSLMIGNAQCWLEQDEKDLNGFIITTIIRDISGVATLLLYNVVALNTAAKVDYKACFDTLKTFAISKGCSKIAAYVMNEKILAMMKAQDIETRFVFAHVNL